jgi:hypothetical protein
VWSTRVVLTGDFKTSFLRRFGYSIKFVVSFYATRRRRSRTYSTYNPIWFLGPLHRSFPLEISFPQSPSYIVWSAIARAPCTLLSRTSSFIVLSGVYSADFGDFRDSPAFPEDLLFPFSLHFTSVSTRPTAKVMEYIKIYYVYVYDRYYTYSTGKKYPYKKKKKSLLDERERGGRRRRRTKW